MARMHQSKAIFKLEQTIVHWQLLYQYIICLVGNIECYTFTSTHQDLISDVIS